MKHPYRVSIWKRYWVTPRPAVFRFYLCQEIHRLTIHWIGRGPDHSLLICYLLIIVTIAQWPVLMRFILQDLRFARNGVPAIARVAKCSYGRNGGINLKYEFRDMDGLLTEGSGEYCDRQTADRVTGTRPDRTTGDPCDQQRAFDE